MVAYSPGPCWRGPVPDDHVVQEREGEPAVVPRVRLSLLATSGDVACRAEVDDQGEARVYVGRPGAGVTAVLSRDSLDLWAGGNVVASVRAGSEGGVLELGDGAGRVVSRLPVSP